MHVLLQLSDRAFFEKYTVTFALQDKKEKKIIRTSAVDSFQEA